MIKTEEEVEQPGAGAIEHHCEVMVEIPEEEGEEAKLVRCRILALEQCQECALWICGTEELEHCIICVRCGGKFCPEHYHSHRLSRECEQVREAA